MKQQQLVINTKLEKRKKKNELNRPPTDDNENYLLFFVFEKYFRFFPEILECLIDNESMSFSIFYVLLAKHTSYRQALFT